jgi:hypothetical protein
MPWFGCTGARQSTAELRRHGGDGTADLIIGMRHAAEGTIHSFLLNQAFQLMTQVKPC